MNDRHSDLPTLIAQARRLVADDRYIWCCASDTFESTIITRRGLLLGGALSPHFLRDHGAMWSDIPWTVRLQRCRVAVCNEAAHEPLTEWLPALEGVAKAGESILVITETMSAEMLRTFAVNLLKGTLAVCAAKPARTRYGHLEPGIESFGTPAATAPAQHDRLPMVAEAWVRRSAAVLFPALTDILSSLSPSPLKDFAIIETGGENHEDQYERLRCLMRELQQQTS
jgi:hypothetical protein